MQFATTEPANLAPRREGLQVACFANQFGDVEGHGLARYARELLEAMHSIGGPNVIPVAGWTGLSEELLEERKRQIGLEFTGLGRHGTKLLWTFLGWPPIERTISQPVDVVHAVSLGYPVATRKPFVVTIHDLGPLTHPEYFRNTRPWVMERSLKQAVNQARIIVCVSQSTANEVIEVAGSSVAERIRVVVEGVSPRFFMPTDPSVLKRFNISASVPFVLSAAMASPRKNLHGLLTAMAIAAKDIPHHVVVVGGSGWDDEALEKALNLPELRGRVHRTGYVSDDELRALYSAADLYVHPSVYEGFGLPILEAMASGTPVVSSDRTSMPEVVGDAGRLCDPTDPEALASAIKDVCSDGNLREEYIRKGKQRASNFRWSDCARAMAEIYEEVAEPTG